MLVLLPYRFTLFSNPVQGIILYLEVLLPYRFTLFSNTLLKNSTVNLVLLPYRFTLFSNHLQSTEQDISFYYLIDLHYSQTDGCYFDKQKGFYYLIDLHYSQTQAR